MESFFAQSSINNMGVMDVVLWPVVAAVVAVVIWVLGCRLEEDDGSRKIKWIAVVPMGFALIKGLGMMLKVVGGSVDAVMYRDVIGGRKMLLAHYGSFVIPLLLTGAMVAYYLMLRRNDRV